MEHKTPDNDKALLNENLARKVARDLERPPVAGYYPGEWHIGNITVYGDQKIAFNFTQTDISFARATAMQALVDSFVIENIGEDRGV